MIKVAVVQMSSSEDKQKNLACVEKYVQQAADQNCVIVALPELFSCMTKKENIAKMAEDDQGITVTTLKKLAKQYKLYINGSMLFSSPDPTKAYNMAITVAPDGNIISRYAKIHLFDVDIPGKVTHKESTYLLKGEHPVVTPMSFGDVGVTICYDLRFPELFRFLREKGAKIILVPSAFTYTTGQHHWEVLLRARAIENQVFILAANQYGDLPNGIKAYGTSLICDPWGNLLAKSSDASEEMIVAVLDFAKQDNIRKEMPVWQHRCKIS